MEYSTNFNFALPSRDNDVDLADINEISNNFRKVDENAVIKEAGKGLSTNDFTNEEKERLANALLPENIDQIYSATSANAQSGIAVAEALKTIVKDLEPAPLGTIDKWEHNRIYKNVSIEAFYIYDYVFDDGTSKTMGNLLPISIVVKTKRTWSRPDGSTLDEDIVYNFDGKNVREWHINPINKSIALNEFIPIDTSKVITEISNTATNNQYPTALAVKNFVNASIDQTYLPESENAQSGIAVAEAVKKSGVRKIRHIELGAGQTANTLKISADEDGNPFELNEAFFTAHLVFDASETTSNLRIRSDGGARYIVLKTGISLSNGIITCSGIINAHGGILSTSAVYSIIDNPQAADTMYGMVSKNANITHNLKDIEMMLYSSTFKELKEGSFLELWGC